MVWIHLHPVKSELKISALDDNHDKKKYHKLYSINRQGLIESKFFFAGGSSRFMFHHSTAKTIEVIENSVNEVRDILPYINGTIGHASDSVVNRLLGCHLAPPIGNDIIRRQPFIISEFAAIEFASRQGPDSISMLIQTFKDSINPAMDGWFLEMLFFSRLRHSGVKLFDSDDKEVGVWKDSQLLSFNLPSFPMIPNDRGIWLKPLKWNQGGFDAVYVDRSLGSVRFIQITRGQSHSLKLEIFCAFLQCLSASVESFVVKRIEIVFLVPRGIINDFRISTIPSHVRSGMAQGQGSAKCSYIGYSRLDKDDQVTEYSA